MREIGGYIELDTYHLPMLHEGAIALNCGRNALAYLLRAREIKRLWIPKLICDSVTGICEREGIPYTLYSVGLECAFYWGASRDRRQNSIMNMLQTMSSLPMNRSRKCPG